jgi:hypothetical protein
LAWFRKHLAWFREHLAWISEHLTGEVIQRHALVCLAFITSCDGPSPNGNWWTQAGIDGHR